jgi:hypothetical protein
MCYWNVYVCICIYTWLNLYLMAAHILKLKFANFIGIYAVMKLQYDSKIVKDYYICIASVYLVFKKQW